MSPKNRKSVPRNRTQSALKLNCDEIIKREYRNCEVRFYVYIPTLKKPWPAKSSLNFKHFLDFAPEKFPQEKN